MSSYAWLAENLSIPIVGAGAGGKHHMRAEWVKAGACDILRAVNGVGGLRPTMKVAALAESSAWIAKSTATERQALAVVGAIRNSPLVRARPAASVPRLR